MRSNHQPYFLRKWMRRTNSAYVEHFIRPQFTRLGKLPQVQKPRHLVLCGDHISIGDHAHINCANDNKVRLTTWPANNNGSASITVGDYCLLSPGTRISAAEQITIGNNCMFAANCYVSDSDWHGIYNRTRCFRCTAPVTLANNVWLGERVIVGKGVSIGENSVIGAGSVVTRDIPANVVAAGSPARVIKQIDPKRRMLKRELIFRDSDNHLQQLEDLDRYTFSANRWGRWLRSIVAPTRED
ncbi:MAG: acyltransferase [Gammaproteobacteria bacterium]|nr:acyltransferase [Gammaproteobacteria bacterium]NND38867.1 acyltransferase [Pseudomonadales bacterium]MBT8152291.1 acyltransferase [Gammaproteobacteria bacterium]NNL11945.1 acyltransferase [Pseudomonadales bacterium]NNM12522.1 acyltransferase [Pseudomonadales bacterium]